MEKKISVVVPTYRRQKLLGKCIEALCSQSFEKADFEIIVVSDGPDRQTHDLLNHLEYLQHPFVQYIALGQNSGPAAARNAGWRSANGRLIAFTDDDTEPDKDWLSAFWKASLRQNQAACGFVGNVKVPISEQPTDFERNTAHLETADFVTANCACTKTVLERVGGFDERFTTAWREDSDLEFRLIGAGIPIIRVPEAVVVHPVRKAAWGVSIREQKKTMFNALLYKKFPALFRQKIQASPEWRYYITIAGAVLCVAGIAILSKPVFAAGAIVYLACTARFIVRRLSATSRQPNHVAEMVVTSLVIPFLSIFWTLYGSVKYRVLFY